jgi:hypothetical protein
VLGQTSAEESETTGLFHVKTLPSNAERPNIAPV